MLFQTPPLDEQERDVCTRLEVLRAALRSQVAPERRWSGMLRRVAAARAIQGSNSIEGLNVTLDDAVAAVAGMDPMDTPPHVWEGHPRLSGRPDVHSAAGGRSKFRLRRVAAQEPALHDGE